MENPNREFEYRLKDVVGVGTGVTLDVVTTRDVEVAGVAVGTAESVGTGVGGVTLLSEAAGGAIHPVTKSDAMIHIKSITDNKHDKW